MLRDEANNRQWRPLCELVSGLDHAEREHVVEQAVSHTLELASNYKRRFLRKTRRPPLTMLWLVWSPPHVGCQERRRCAQDLLDEGDEELGPTMAKFRRACGALLEDAAATGHLNRVLWQFIAALAAVWTTDIQ